MLGVREGSSLFRVVETTDFNQLPHITLAFRPGNDGAVKAFLASRLGEVKGAHARLEAALCRTQVPLRPCCIAP
jgi:spindle assembly abnormal protein 6